MRTKSIYARVVAPFILALLSAIALLYWVATYSLTQALETRLRTQVEQAVQVLAAGGVPLTAELIKQLGTLQAMEFLLLDQAGQIAISTIDVTYPDREALHGAALAITTDRGPAVSAGHLLLAVSLDSSRSQQYSVLVGLATTAEADAAAREMFYLLGATALLALILLSIWGHRLSRRLADPIGALADMADRIAKGERDVAMATSQIEEIEQLNQALAQMSQSLRDFEAQLAQTHRLRGLGELAAQVAHEIRNPLTAIKLHIQLLAEQSEATQQTVATQVLDEIQRLELVVGSTLAVARPLTMNQEPTDLAQPIREVVDVLSVQFSHRGIGITLNIQPVTCPIDPARIKQVIFNLLNNAANALPEGGKIHISLHAEDQQAVVTVADNGPGVAPQAVASLFTEPSDSNTGLGIGLMLSKQIVDLHQGNISYRTSDALGGACFMIRFPRPATETKKTQDG